ncbi:hypothetical protein GOP47_0017005 [Adiantum capillus-veneris]|uniref:Lipase n=1 Tax=Adiantum capillus-veneris TaxID=13818 RepID=A0A9D4UHP2_ADICA|nr:hypothetical protein GOP47_0016217 [Adiantum capillus-veneris]KAI5068660.1 hypothetical protein GOP47_0017005 [Adiantum capillus-veneris]
MEILPRLHFVVVSWWGTVILHCLVASVVHCVANSVPLVAQSVSNPSGICALLVLNRGYNCQEFKVPTTDGFWLGVQRISSRKFRASKGPAFLYHGLMQGGDIWVLNAPEESLGFLLVDNGYDVWLGSTRSSKFSYGHASFLRSDPEFWNWGWDDLVSEDLPSMLRFVHMQTSQLIYFVGYSQGTMTAFAAFSQSDVADLVKKAAMLSPIAYLNHVTSPVASIVSWLFLDKVLLLAGVHQFNISDAGGKQVINAVCSKLKRADCFSDLLSLVTGPNCCINKSLISYYNKFELQTTSMKNLAQMAQLLRTGRFGKYDYGWFRNLGHYGDFFPPSYQLRNIPGSLPIMLAHGGQDQLADEMDVRHLMLELPSVTQLLFVPHYAHGDFVLGFSARTLVYHKLLLFFAAT